eukprot:9329016-Ditylum_brightwellii.AAC.1
MWVQLKKAMQIFAKEKGSIKELMDTASDSTAKETIKNLFSSSNQVSFTKKNVPIIYSLLLDFCKNNNIITGIKE